MSRRIFLGQRQRTRRAAQELGAAIAAEIRARRAKTTDAVDRPAASPQPAADPTLPPASPTEDDR
jgi:hypothetical protein